jgi:hypothetical protein
MQTRGISDTVSFFMLARCLIFNNAYLEKRDSTTELAIKMMKTALPNIANVPSRCMRSRVV